jgi:methylated-DNA-[protein]-cysteine S-methyltransferase
MPGSKPTFHADSDDVSADFAWVFCTEIGWITIVGHHNKVRSISVGHSTEGAAKKAIGQSSPRPQYRDWSPELRRTLTDYARGKRVHFDQFDLLLPRQTPFQDRVLAATRRLAYGQTSTYGELARQVGHPRAARAVGTVMSTNRLPILIPCHRVLAAGGKLGGYTSPAGTDLKQLLLNLERAG